MLQHLLEWLNIWSRIDTKYRLLKYDEDRRDTSVRLGVNAIIYSVLGLLFVIPCVAGFVVLWDHFTSIRLMDGTYDFPLFTILGMVVLVGTVVLLFFHTAAHSVTLTIYQFKLNRRPIRWAALGASCVSLIGMICAVAVAVFLVLRT